MNMKLSSQLWNNQIKICFYLEIFFIIDILINEYENKNKNNNEKYAKMFENRFKDMQFVCT